jgi:hypothetical protein
MSLIRTTIVVAAVVAMLPSDGDRQEHMLKQIAAAATWTFTFCDRNAELCQKAGVFWAEFSKKAQFAAQVAYDLAERSMVEQEEARMAPASYSPAVHTPAPAQVPAAEPQRGTLTPHDMRPGWRGNGPRQGV